VIRVSVFVAVFALVIGACSSEGTAPGTPGESAPGTTGVATTQPSGSATTTTVTSDVGTIENPLPGGEFGVVGDWEIRVIGVVPDALDAVQNEYEEADLPEDGNQFFMIALEARYAGPDSGNFWSDMGWKAVGPSAVAYEESDSQCGFIPNSISDTNEAFPGGVVTGNLCWSVTTDDAQELLLLLEPFFAVTSDRTVYALDPLMADVPLLSPASADLSSLPTVEIGDAAQIGDWKVRVVDVNPQATDVVMAEYEYSDPPEDGHQFVMATLEVEYRGAESSDFWADMTWKALGPSSVTYGESTDRCGMIPDDIVNVGEVFAGGVFTANVCWSVTTTDAADLRMVLEEFAIDSEGRTFYRLVVGN